MKWLHIMAGILLSIVFFSACGLTDLKAKAGLQVITDNVGAGVYLDGKFLDKTPYVSKDLKPGDYSLEIRPDDTQLATYETKISLKKGLLTVITWKPNTRPETSGGVIYEMESLSNPKQSSFSLLTIPDGAIVRVDGQAKGFAPVLVENMSSGEHEYEVTLPSYETQKHTINVLQGYQMDVTVKLAKLDYTTPSPTSSVSADLTAPTPATATPVISSPFAASSSPQLMSSLPPPKVRIKPTGVFVNGTEVVHVRNSASSTGQEIGTAPVGTEYQYLQQTTNGWYKISFNGQTAWVSIQYGQLIQ